MSGGPPAAAHRSARWLEVVHHALSAAVMASVVLALEHRHGLDWLDAIMLRIVGPTTSASAADDARPLPQLVLIDAAAYADAFGLRSPLDRDAVAAVIGDVLSAHPRTVVVDLQLEPAAFEALDRPLDRLLKAAASTTQIVLPVPEARTAALDRRSMAWMRSMCAAGVVFGTAQIRSHFGTVVRFDVEPSSLSQLVDVDGGSPANLAHADADAHAPAHPAVGAEPAFRGGAVCQMAALGAELGAVGQMLATTGETPLASEPLAVSAIRRLSERALAWQPDRTREALQSRRPRVVVLGGSYDSRDAFLTSAGAPAVPGAVVHAAAIASRGAVGAHHGLGWGLDVVVGTVLGVFFTGAWKAIGRLHGPESLFRWPMLRHVLGAWIRLVVGGAFWIVVVGIAGALTWLSARGLSHGWWLNPGPIVLGMFLDALIAKNLPQHHGAPGGVHGKIRMLTEHCPAWLLQVALIGFALNAYLWHSGHH